MAFSRSFIKARIALWQGRLTFAEAKVEEWKAKVAVREGKVREWKQRLADLPVPATGIDVSVFQGEVDWAAVKASGVDFVWVKSTEGEDFRDRRFLTNVRGARAAGLKVGAYHFVRPRIRAGGAAAEIADFVKALKEAGLGEGDLRPVLDIESTTLGAQATRNYARDAIIALRNSTGIKPIFYTFPSFLGGEWPSDFAEVADLWVAHFGVDTPTLPRPWGRYVAHQWTERGTVKGVAGNVDRNKAPDIRALIA